MRSQYGVVRFVGESLSVTGANWSAAIRNPFQRFGSTGEGLENHRSPTCASPATSRRSARFTSSRRAPIRRPRQILDHPHDDRRKPMTEKRPHHRQRHQRLVADRDCAVDAAEKVRGTPPGNIRYRVSRMTREPRMPQKDAAWQVMEAALPQGERRRPLPAWRGKSTIRRARKSWR